ncbi:MAG: leucine-rich repeat domain-containing protein [Eubacterium sp.]|nr:leucine-rich repeat domain-containing protein [Eubacterium sp.]
MKKIVGSRINLRILKRACCLVISALAVLLLCTHSSSAKVHSGTYEGNTRWYYDTRTKTVTIDCKGRMEDGDQHGVSMGWHGNEWYLKAECVVFKKGITYVGVGTFDNFRKVKEVVLPEGLVSIGSSAFWSTPKLKKISFPSSLKKIRRDAFDGSGLESVSLKHVEKVGSGAFSGSGLRHITIPAGTSFGSYAFSGCDDLKSVRIEEGVKTLSYGMFSQCGFKRVIIPASVTEIGEHAFFAFSPEEGKLKKVTIRSTKIKKWGKGIFGKARKDLVIRVPKSKKKAYTKALRRGGLPEYVKIIELY